MGWVSLALAIFQLIFKVWDAVHESDKEKKLRKAEALKDGIEAVVKKDATGISLAFSRLNRI